MARTCSANRPGVTSPRHPRSPSIGLDSCRFLPAANAAVGVELQAPESPRASATRHPRPTRCGPAGTRAQRIQQPDVHRQPVHHLHSSLVLALQFQCSALGASSRHLRRAIGITRSISARRSPGNVLLGTARADPLRAERPRPRHPQRCPRSRGSSQMAAGIGIRQQPVDGVDQGRRLLVGAVEARPTDRADSMGLHRGGRRASHQEDLAGGPVDADLVALGEITTVPTRTVRPTASTSSASAPQTQVGAIPRRPPRRRGRSFRRARSGFRRRSAIEVVGLVSTAPTTCSPRSALAVAESNLQRPTAPSEAAMPW